MSGSMEIRPITEMELPLAAELWRNAYRLDSKTAQRWISNTEISETRAFVADGRCLSLIRILPYTVFIGGRRLSMGGIGAVATWVDQQGRGLAGQLMSYSVGEMRRLGHSVSFLYPFSHRYYAKFGWGTVGQQHAYGSFSQADVKRLSCGATVRAAITPSDYQTVRALYAALAPTFNGMVDRSEPQWERFLSRATGDHSQIYLIYQGGTPTAFFQCIDTAAPDGKFCTTAIPLCPDHESCLAMFGFLAQLPSNVGSLRIVAPRTPLLNQYFREPWVELRLSPMFQARVVDVEAACSSRGYSHECQADVIFALQDEYGPWNTGTWRLCVAEGSATIEKTLSAPQVVLTIQQFSTLFMGSEDPREWVKTGFLLRECRGAAEQLACAFYDQQVNLLDSF